MQIRREWRMGLLNSRERRVRSAGGTLDGTVEQRIHYHSLGVIVLQVGEAVLLAMEEVVWAGEELGERGEGWVGCRVVT